MRSELGCVAYVNPAQTCVAVNPWREFHEDGRGTHSLAGSQLGEVRHVCAFFNSDEEEYRVLLPFIKDGFRVWRQGGSRG